MCLPVLDYKFADKQEDKLQDGIPVSTSYIKNGIFKQQERILYEAPFWRERGPIRFIKGGQLIPRCLDMGKFDCVLWPMFDCLISFLYKELYAVSTTQKLSQKVFADLD